MKRLRGLALAAIVGWALIAPAPLARALTETVRYKRLDEGTLRMDVYRPTSKGEFPAVLLVHGGGWQSGTRKEWIVVGRKLARRGFVALAPEYRLAPPGGTSHAPQALEDIIDAVDWIRANADDVGADPDRLGALGTSAGGHLALLAAFSTNAFDAVAAWSGVTDLTAPEPRALHEIVTNYIGCPLAECSGKWQNHSPVTHVSSDDPPVLLVNSRSEFIPLAQVTLLEEALGAEDVDVATLILPGRRHGSEYAERAFGATFKFLSERLAIDDMTTPPSPPTSPRAVATSAPTSGDAPGVVLLLLVGGAIILLALAVALLTR